MNMQKNLLKWLFKTTIVSQFDETESVKKKKKKVALKYKVEFEENLWSEYSVLSDDVNTSNCMKRGGTEDLLLFNTLVASSHVNQTTWCLVLSAKT